LFWSKHSYHRYVEFVHGFNSCGLSHKEVVVYCGAPYAISLIAFSKSCEFHTQVQHFSIFSTSSYRTPSHQTQFHKQYFVHPKVSLNFFCSKCWHLSKIVGV
jgi:hypothetical protein